MKIDLDQIIAVAKPWELELAIAGGTCRVKRLSTLQMRVLSEPTVAEAEVRRVLREVIEPLDVVEGWSVEEVTAVVAAIVAYYREHVIRKNVEAISRAMTSGGSRPTGATS